ncbi:MAG: T9SS type A sorting domain-containing protein [Bacteroidales bacterium]|nr:T9SS type A sorting domain-containing protein [Bacteroidales bacterium]
MKIKFIILNIILSSIVATAQVKFVGVLSNPNLEAQQNNKPTSSRAIKTDRYALFFDDFAQNDAYPNSYNWLDSNVYINSHYPYKPPSYGVATFDILDKNGQMYSRADIGQFIADTLTSRYINLSAYNLSDSIYLSFFYQPKGYGWDSPDSKDSLVLQFKDSLNLWHSVWSVSGTSLHPFKLVLKSLDNLIYYHSLFQFRFYNYATLGDPVNQEDAITNDFWHLDYVLLDTARSINDTSFIDVSLYNFEPTLFHNLYSVPWSHYDKSKMTLDSVIYFTKNLSATQQPITQSYYMLTQNSATPIDYFEPGAYDILAFSDTIKRFSQDMMAGNGNADHIPNLLNDSTTLDVKMYIKTTEPTYRSQRINDTLTFQQCFYNYYAYDDGTAESGLALVSFNAKFAFKIIPLKADTLRGISAFFNRYKDFRTADDPIFTLAIWSNLEGKPDTLIYSEEHIEPKYATGMQQFSTYKLETPLYVDDTFYIGFISETEKLYSIGYDMQHNNQSQVYYQLNGGWNALAQGVPMLRAIMGDDFELVGMKEIKARNNIKIYPNPAKDYVVIETTHDVETIHELSLQIKSVQFYDLTGQLVKSSVIDTSQAFTIDISDLQKGIYIIKVGEQINKLIIQ